MENDTMIFVVKWQRGKGGQSFVLLMMAEELNFNNLVQFILTSKPIGFNGSRYT